VEVIPFGQLVEAVPVEEVELIPFCEFTPEPLAAGAVLAAVPDV